jgi:hypothetical protein
MVFFSVDIREGEIRRFRDGHLGKSQLKAETKGKKGKKLLHEAEVYELKNKIECSTGQPITDRILPKCLPGDLFSLTGPG